MRVLDEGVTRVGLSIIWERLKRKNVSVHDLLALDKSILKLSIKIISLDSSQTESIIQKNVSTQFTGLLFANKEGKKGLPCDIFDTFVAHSGLVPDVTDPCCQAQNGSTHIHVSDSQSWTFNRWD